MDIRRALMPVTPVRAQSQPRQSFSEDTKLLHSLNLRLQYKVHSLENENVRLKEEIQGYKGKGYIYDSLTKDLASLRTQLDKTALALLKKCEAYDTVKKELAALKVKYSISPRRTTPKKNNLKKLAIYQDIMRLGDDDGFIVPARSGRPSMGSCGNLVDQISADEVMPSCLKVYTESSAPLRNRLLTKLHTLNKAASTESLESVGRKSIRAEEVQGTKRPTKVATPSVKKIKPNLNTSLQPITTTKPSTLRAPPSVRPALGQSNGRVIKVTTIKKSNSSCSAKNGSTKPTFRL